MIQTNFELRAYNTFGIASQAERFLSLNSLDQLTDLVKDEVPSLILGAGSNLLLLNKVPGLTLGVELKGLQDVTTTPKVLKKQYAKNEVAIIRVGAGVNWHQLVLHTLGLGLHGLENMALIPGTVGAAPVQNIGAYGAEVAQFIEAVHVWEFGKGPAILSPQECQFGYRDSLFKQSNGRYLITAVDFKLGGKYQPKISYGAVQDRLTSLFPDLSPSPKRVARAVIEIRAEKLPFYSQLGNSGSFFKNPIISTAQFEALQEDYPNMPSYPAGQHQVKVPAGWLIDQAGWKGKRSGTVGTYPKQALVIVNYGGATGQEILDFSEQIKADVFERYQIKLEREVRLIGVH